MITCLYCNAEFELGAGSEEHVIPRFLGARLKTRNACCTGCNNKLGNEVDSSLDPLFSILVNGYGILTEGRVGDKGRTLRGVATKEGEVVELQPGGQIRSRTTVQMREQDGLLNMELRVPTNERLSKILDGIARKQGMTREELLKSGEFEARRYWTPSPQVEFSVSLGPTQRRAAVKCCLNAMSRGSDPTRVRVPELEVARRFVADEEAPTRPPPTGLVRTGPIETTTLAHSVAVWSLDGRLYGSVQFFDIFVWATILAEDWPHDAVDVAYAYDPIGRCEVPLSWRERIAWNASALQDYAQQLEVVESALSQSIPAMQEYQREQLPQRLTDAAMADFAAKFGDRPIFEPDMIEWLARRVAGAATAAMAGAEMSMPLELDDLLRDPGDGA